VLSPRPGRPWKITLRAEDILRPAILIVLRPARATPFDAQRWMHRTLLIAGFPT
jgi:hypothetical protein